MDIRSVNVEQSNPIAVSFDFELFLSHTKGFQRLIEASHLHESNAIKRPSLRFFIAHSDLIESFHCPVRKDCSVSGKIELEVNLGFVEIAQSDVTLASAELFSDTSKTLQCLAVSAP